MELSRRLMLLAFGIAMGIVGFYLGAIVLIKILLLMIISILMFKNPIYGIAAFIMALPFVSNTNLLLLGIYVTVIYLIRVLWKGEFTLSHAPINIFIVLFMLLIIFNTGFSIDVQGSIRDFSIHMIALSIVFLIINSKKKEGDLRLLSGAFVIAATLVSLYGIYQFFTGVQMESGWVDTAANPDVRTRVFSTFENPNLLAEYLLMIIPIGGAFVLTSKNIVKKGLYTGAVAIMVLAIFMTLSRGGWLGLGAGLVLFLFLTNIKLLIALIPLGLIGTMFLPQVILQRISTIASLQDSSNFYRYQLWGGAVRILKDFWVSGVGLGYLPFRKISGYYITNMAPFHTHNTYLQVAIEMGVVGLLVLMLIVISGIKMGIGVAANEKNTSTKVFVSAFIAALVGIMVHGVAEHVLYNPKIIFHFWLTIAMITSYYIAFKEGSLKDIKDREVTGGNINEIN